MATGSKRDVRLAVGIETSGQDSIRALADEVARLAKQGGDAAPEYQLLVEALDRLQQRAAALDAFKELSADVERLSAAQRTAAGSAADVAVAYAAQSDAVERLRVAQANARKEFDQAKAGVDDLTLSLRKARAEGAAAGEAEDAYAARLRETRVQIAEQKRALEDRRQALATSNRELTDAVSAESKLAAEYSRKASASERATVSLSEQTSALSAARAANEALGTSVADLTAAENELLATRQKLAGGIDEARLKATREQAAADALAAQEARGRAQAQEAGAIAARSELAAIADSEKFLRQYAAAAEAAAAADLASAVRRDAEAMRLLEAAAAQADAEMLDLTRSVAAAEAAAREFTAATEAAAAAGADDARVVQQRVAAATALVESERGLTVAQRELTVARDSGRAALVAEAQALLASARAAEESRAASLRLVQAAQSAGTVLKDAFGTVGVRSMQAIEAEIQQVSLALSTLERRARTGAIGADDLARASSSAQVRLATLKRELETMPSVAGPFERISGTINDLISRFGALGAAVATVGIVARPIIETEVALEQMRRVLTTVTGSSAEAAKQIEFLRMTAQFSGQSFNALGESYSKFAASALQVGLSTKQVEQTFASVATASGNLGLSSDQAKRALEALSQIASKGVASMEELRQQLGDALPGVLPLLAGQLGLTTQELNKLVASGQLLAVEAIPAIAASLEKLAPAGGSPVQGLVAEWERFKNVISETTTVLTEGFLGQTVAAGLAFLGARIKEIAFLAAVLSEGVTTTFKTIGLAAAALANGDLKLLKDGFTELSKQSQDRLDGLANRITGLGDSAAKTSVKTKTLGSAVAEAIGKVEDTTPALNAHADAHARVAAATAGHGAAQTKLATEVKSSAGALDGNYRSLSQLILANVKAVDSAEQIASASAKVAEARKTEAAQIQQIAALSGDEAVAKQGAAAASVVLQQGLDAEAAADARVVIAVQNSIASLREYAATHGISTEAIKGSIEKLEALVLSKQADAEKSRAAAEAATAEATARRLAVEVLKDNTSRYVEFKAAVQDAELALSATIRAFERDKATTQDVTNATNALAVAKRLLRDSIDDTARASERNIAIMKADAEIAKASLQVKLEEAKNAVRAAELLGNETQIRLALVKQKEIEEQITRAVTEAKRAEANEIIRGTTLQLEELKATGQLTPEKQLELELRIKNAQAKLLEANAAVESNKKLEDEIKLLRQATTAIQDKTRATDANTASNRTNSSTPPGTTSGSGGRLDQNGLDSRGRNADGLYPGGTSGIPNSGVAPMPPLGSGQTTSPSHIQVGADGFVTNNGATQNAGTFLPQPSTDGPWQWVPMLNQGYDYGGYWVNQQGKQYTGMATAPYGWNRSSFLGEPMANLGTSLYDQTHNGPTPYQAGDRTLGGGSQGAQTTAAQTQPAATSQSAATGGGYSVTVNLNGRSTKVNVASPSDADALARVLQELEDAADRGG